MTIKDFEEYIEMGIAKKQTPDLSRARALLKELEQSYEVLKLFIEKVCYSKHQKTYKYIK